MSEKKIPYKIYLEESEMPRAWYNLRAHMKNKPAPLLNPGTLKPMTAEELSVVFCDELVKQEMDNDTAYFEIPGEIRDFYKMYRPSPLVRAYCLEEKLQTPAKIYYKFEGNNTSGSHKLNSAIAQAYYAKNQGLKGVTTETGAGQWGTALSMACSYLGLDCRVYMVKCSYEQKPFRREVMKVYGADVTPSPSDTTNVGRKILAEYPGTGGSLGCAISEAVEVATSTEGYRYVLGSVLNQVLLHQSIIGLETKTAMDKYGIKPDIIIGCAGGGSNLGGLISPFMGEKLRGEAAYRFIVEDVYPGQRLHPQLGPCGGPQVPRHEQRAVAALRRRPYGGYIREADRCVQGRRGVRKGGGYTARPGEQPRHFSRRERGPQVQGDRRGEDHPVWAYRHRLL